MITLGDKARIRIAARRDGGPVRGQDVQVLYCKKAGHNRWREEPLPGVRAVVWGCLGRTEEAFAVVFLENVEMNVSTDLPRGGRW